MVVQVKFLIGKCLVCRHHEGGPYKMPSFAPLPKTCVTEATPFSRTGLDYLGPMFIRTGKDQRQVWICLFTCLMTRALHLELLRVMSTEEFLLGFRIKRTFIVELAPWMGGFYERLVSLVKRALRKTFSRKLLDYVQLQTILKEVGSTVNSRPLPYVSDDIASTITLTQNHLLSLNPHTGIQDLEYDTNDNDYMPYKSTTERLLETWKKAKTLKYVLETLARQILVGSSRTNQKCFESYT